jgi:hypothetical protein
MNTAKPKIEMLEKHVSKAFGKKVYLLGTFQDGHNFWLEEPKWELRMVLGLWVCRNVHKPMGTPRARHRIAPAL